MYLGIFENRNDVIREFNINGLDESIVILFAQYDYQDYEGYAFVLFERDGKLYEVNGSHCSCYGLEDQWCPEETSVEAVKHYMDNGRLGSDYRGMFASELQEVLNQWGG